MDTFSASAWGYEFGTSSSRRRAGATQLATADRPALRRVGVARQRRRVAVPPDRAQGAARGAAWSSSRGAATTASRPSSGTRRTRSTSTTSSTRPASSTTCWTTDADRVERLPRGLGHDRVGVLPFAAQPALHNPMRQQAAHQAATSASAACTSRTSTPSAASRWTCCSARPTRSRRGRDTGLEIFSRYLERGRPVPVPRAARAARASARSTTRGCSRRTARTRCSSTSTRSSAARACVARRIFEITACGTPVVSTRSAAVEHCSRRRGLRSSTIRRRPSGRSARSCAHPSCATARCTPRSAASGGSTRTRTASTQVLAAAGLARSGAPGGGRASALIAPTNRPHLVPASSRPRRARRRRRAAVLLAARVRADRRPSCRRRPRGWASTELVVLARRRRASLGDVPQPRSSAASDGDVVAKMDDDDLYGADYLRDACYALDYSGAELVGKQAHHMYLEAHRSDRACGSPSGSTGSPTSSWDRPSSRRDDVGRRRPSTTARSARTPAFLRAILAAGGGIYSADRFNFIQMRGARGWPHVAHRGRARSWPTARCMASASRRRTSCCDGHALTSRSTERRIPARAWSSEAWTSDRGPDDAAGEGSAGAGAARARARSG